MRFSDLGWNPNQFDHFGEWCPVRLGMIPVLRTTLWMFFHDLYVQNMYRIYDVCIVYVTYIYIEIWDIRTYMYTKLIHCMYVACCSPTSRFAPCQGEQWTWALQLISDLQEKRLQGRERVCQRNIWWHNGISLISPWIKCEMNITR